MTGSDSDDFSIDGGVLTFNSPPDHENPADASTDNNYLVTVNASDGTHTDTMTVTVTVTDVNEAPAFAIETATRSVAENTAAGQDIGLPVTATDPDDGDSLTYTLDAASAELFGIDSSTGQLQTKADLDFEGTNSYTVTVTATDLSDAFDTITVTIDVTDVNEPAAFDDGETATRTIDENTAASQNIGTPLTATDPDAGDVLTYTLSGADEGSFTIIESTGQLQTKAALDYETKPSYTVTVSVSDSKDAGGSGDSAADDTITVTVTITNVNEEGTVTLSSVQPQVGASLTAALEDPDGDVTGERGSGPVSPASTANGRTSTAQRQTATPRSTTTWANSCWLGCPTPTPKAPGRARRHYHRMLCGPRRRPTPRRLSLRRPIHAT